MQLPNIRDDNRWLIALWILDKIIMIVIVAMLR